VNAPNIATAGLDFDLDTAGPYLNITRRQTERLWRSGKLSGVKVGNSVRFTQADLDDFVARNRKQATA